MWEARNFRTPKFWSSREFYFPELETSVNIISRKVIQVSRLSLPKNIKPLDSLAAKGNTKALGFSGVSIPWRNSKCLQTTHFKYSQRPLLILLPHAYVCIWRITTCCCFPLLRAQGERSCLSFTGLRGKEKCLLTVVSYPPAHQVHVLCIVQRTNVLAVFGEVTL